MDLKEEDPPQRFVNWGAVKRVLDVVNDDNVVCSLVMKTDGALLCVAGDVQQGKTISALVGNIWKSYTGEHADADNMSMMLFDCEEGKLVVSRISKFLLCLYAPDRKANLGLLKKKIEACSQHLQSLRDVYPTTV